MLTATDADNQTTQSEPMDVRISNTKLVLNPNADVQVITAAAAVPNAQGDIAIPTAAAKPKVGQILASEQGKGYLRKVTAVKTENGQTIVQTKPAGVPDVVSDLEFSSSFELGLLPAQTTQAGVVQTGANTVTFSDSKYAYTANSHAYTPAGNWQQVGLQKVLQPRYVSISGVRVRYPKVIEVSVPTGQRKATETFVVSFEREDGKSFNFENADKIKNKIKLSPDKGMFQYKAAKKISDNKFEVEVTISAEESKIAANSYDLDINAYLNSGVRCWGECHVGVTTKVYVTRAEQNVNESQDQKIYDKDGLKVDLNVDTVFNPRAIMGGNITGKSLNNMEISLGGDALVTQTLSIKADGKKELSEHLVELIRPRHFVKVFMAGAVPIVVAGELQLNASVKGEISGALDVEQKMEFGFKDLKIGVKYANGQFHAIKEQTPVYHLTVEGEGNAEAQLEIHVLPSLKITTYNSASAYVVVDPYLKVQAGIEGNLRAAVGKGVEEYLAHEFNADYRLTKATLGGGVNLFLAADLTIWNVTLLQYPICEGGEGVCTDWLSRNTSEKLNLKHGDVLKNFRKFQPFTLRPATDILRIPQLSDIQVGLDSAEFNQQHTRWIKLEVRAENYKNPLSNLFGGYSVLPWQAWTKPTVQGADSTIFAKQHHDAFLNYPAMKNRVGEDAQPSVQTLWIDPTSAGKYKIRMGGYSTLGAWARQYAEVEIELLDANNNGMLDYWETRFGVTDPNADPDQDGLTNLGEFLRGSHPLKADANITLQSAKNLVVREANGKVYVRWDAVKDAAFYQVWTQSAAGEPELVQDNLKNTRYIIGIPLLAGTKVIIKAISTAGEIASTSSKPQETADKPVVLGISPEKIQVNQTQTITIVGNHLPKTLAVSLTGANCQNGKWVSAKKYTISCQHDKAETLNMVVRAGAKVLKTQAITFTAAPVPASVKSILPMVADIATLTSFEIQGQNLPAQLNVTLGGATCAAGKWVSSSKYTISCQHEKAEKLNMIVKEGTKLLKTQVIQFNLPAPQNAKAVKQGTNDIKVTWQGVKGATAYNVYHANESFKNKAVGDYASMTGGTKLASLTGEETTLTNIDKTKKYYIVVTAVDAGGNESGKSNEAQIKLDNSTPSKASKLNDTGITTCGTADRSNNQADCSQAVANATGAQVPLGQDGHYGTGKNGSYGMVFSHVEHYEGKCVQDEHTGLMWEVKQTTAGLHHKDNTYSWYNPDSTTNGGNVGKQNYGKCTGSDCDTAAFVKAVNQEKWCGFNDWRMPTRKELNSIVDYSRLKPAIDTTYFPNTANEYFWSASPSADYNTFAWFVYFGFGSDNDSSKDDAYRVRLVRAR